MESTNRKTAPGIGAELCFPKAHQFSGGRGRDCNLKWTQAPSVWHCSWF